MPGLRLPLAVALALSLAALSPPEALAQKARSVARTKAKVRTRSRPKARRVRARRQRTLRPRAPRSRGRRLRLMTWNLKSGELASLDKIARRIRKEKPDIVALQEMDQGTRRSGRVDQARKLGELTGMHSLFQKATPMDGGNYGLALLSRHPIKKVRRVKLPSEGEQRILVVADVEVQKGRVVPMAVTHLGLTGPERRRQVSEILSTLPQDAILAGDFNEGPRASGIRSLKRKYRDAWSSSGRGSGKTFPSDRPDRRIDYVLLGRGWRAREARVPETTDSDHRPIVVDVEAR